MQTLQVPVVLLCADKELVVNHLAVGSLDLVKQPRADAIGTGYVLIGVIHIVVKLRNQKDRTQN